MGFSEIRSAKTPLEKYHLKSEFPAGCNFQMIQLYIYMIHFYPFYIYMILVIDINSYISYI